LLVQIGIVLSIWMYCLATGLEASALRATTVATLVVLSGRFGRRADPLTILALASAGLLLIQPSLVGSVGFWLSVSASGAIAGTFVASHEESQRSDLLSGLYGLVAAQFATLPIVVWAFGTLSVTGLLANVLISPVMVLAFPITFVYAAVAFVPVIDDLSAFIPGLLSDLTLAIVQRLEPIIDPIYLDSAGKGAALLVALPCALVVLSLNRDIQRWLPRLKATTDEKPSAAFSGIGGAIVGLLLSVAIWLLMT
jgi:ComEC/Rec2-related protein